jgi:hypothetical protein
MADIRKIIQTTLEGPAFMLRPDAYRPGDAQELIADIVSLANSVSGGKRYIVFGVESMPGSTERRVPGMSEAPNTGMWQQLVREYVEPDVSIEYRTEVLADRKVGVLIIPHCVQQPYMLRRALGTIERGASFIRRGTTRERLVREDLELIYARRYDYATRFAGLRVGFSADEPAEMLALQCQRETALPSYAHTSKVRELLDARSYVERSASTEDSGIVRMVHMRVFGNDVPYESKSVAQLQQELLEIEAAFRDEDRHARYERDAARVNLTVSNESAEPLDEAALVVHFPVAKGFEVIAGGGPMASGRLEGKNESAAMSVARTLGRIEQGTRVAAFAEPLRVVLTSECRHRVLPVRYELRAANLPIPMQGKLRFEVA